MEFSHPFFKIERSAAKRAEGIAYWKAHIYDKTTELREAERLAEDLIEKDLKEGEEEKPGVDYEAIKDEIKYAIKEVKEAKKRHVDHLTTAEFCISTLEFFNAAAAANVNEMQTQLIMLKIFKEFKEGNDLAVTRFFKDQALKLRLPAPRHPPTWTA
jgi:hypothetical protein